MKFGNEFWLILSREYISPNLFAVQATKSTVLVRPKDIFCVNFGQEGHLPTQHPGFGSKLSSKGKPGTCALLETLQSPVKLLGLLYKFCILPTYFL
jgi:hypothetical protein